MDDELEKARALRDRAQWVYEQRQRAAGQPSEKERADRILDEYRAGGGGGGASETWYRADGREIPVYGPDQKMGGGAESQGYSMSRYLRGLYTGDTRGLTNMEKAALAEGTTGAGGALVPQPLAADFIDKVRNQAVVFQAGARVVPMDSATLKIGRVLTDPAVGWKAENATWTASDMTFDQVTLTAHTMISGAKMSIEVFEDAPNMNDLVTATLAKVTALELDRAALLGDGTANSPTGIRNASGVTVDSTTFGTNGAAISGTTPTGAVAFDWLSKAIYGRRAVNEQPTAVVYASRTAGELDLLRASTGEPLQPPASVAGIQQLVTNAIPITLTQGTSSDCSLAILGDYGQLLVGVRDQLVVEATREGSDSGGNAWSALQVIIRVFMRADIQLARPAAFAVVTGIR